MATTKYRFENGKLFKFDAASNAYIFVFSSIYATTKAKAIKAYENQA